MPTNTGVKLSTLSYVIIYVKDTAKATEFYRDTLGMKVKMESPGWVELDTGATTLALHGTETIPTKPTEAQPCFVFNTDDVYATYDSLKKAGLNISEPKEVCEEGDKIGLSADFSDLDGNQLSIFSLVSKNKVRK